MNYLSIIKQITGKKKLAYVEDDGIVNDYLGWYKGKTAWHSYNVYNGKNYIKCERFSLNMAKRVCEDWASLLINEKTDIVLKTKQSQEKLYDILEDCKFWKKANRGIEKAFALGGGAFVLSVDDLIFDDEGNLIVDESNSPKINVTFVNRTKIIPITIKDERINECAFVNVYNDHTYVSIHLLDESGNYVIHNITASGSGSRLNYDADNPSNYYIFDTKNNIPWFVIVHPNIVNNVDIESPFGISIYANAIDILKEVDIVFDSYANEFLLGKKRIFISSKNMAIDPETGEFVRVFDSNDTVYYVLPEADDGKLVINNDTQPLRVNDHNIGMQQVLNLLSYSCGFGTNHYKFDQGGVSTATQIISENSDMFRNLKRHEIVIEEALIDLTKAILYASTTFTNIKFNANDIDDVEIKFDDSIVEDKAAEKADDRLDVQMGVMSPAEYRSKWYAEDIAVAEAKIAEMDKYSIVDDEDEEDTNDATEDTTDGQDEENDEV